MVTFPANSYIIVEGKKEVSNFFIIREGKVRVSRETAVVGEDPNQVLGPGDFFGVVAAMSQHPQIESALSLTNVSLISVSYDQFGTLIQKSTAVAMNIIRFFSMKLRQFDTTITRMSFRDAAEEDPNELFQIGEYYFQQGNTGHATFAYQSYLKHVPNGEFVPQTKMRLQTSNQPFQGPPIDYTKFNRFYQDNETIFCEHEPGKELFIIQQGKVKISKIVNSNEVMLAVLQTGDIFGEMAILDNKPRSASAVAFGEVELLAISKANFEGMVKAQPQLATRLITLLSERIWIAYKQLANLLLKDPTARIVDTLMMQLEKNRVKIAPKGTYNFQLGSKDLLKMVGLTDPKDELLLADIMKQNKYIRLDLGKIVCSDLAELEKLVQFYHKKVSLDNKLRKK